MDDTLLEKLLAVSVTPDEEENLHSLLKKEIYHYSDKIESFKNGCLIAFKTGTPGLCSLMLDAHIDEVFAVVTGMTEDGFLRFHTNSIDEKILPGAIVTVHGTRGLKGIIGVKPHHLIPEEDFKKAFEIKNLFIDCGLSKTEVEQIVPIGSFVTFLPNYLRLNSSVSSKSLDDRVGAFILVEILKRLKRSRPIVNVICHFASQEETTGFGATTSTYDLRPDFAIAIDVTHGTSPNVSNVVASELGKGPVVFIGPSMDRLIVQKILDVSSKYDIPIQKEIGLFSGTDATDIQVVGEGIPVSVVSVPLRYMHTAVELANVRDIEQTINLLSLFILEIDENFMGGLHGEH